MPPLPDSARRNGSIAGLGLRPCLLAATALAPVLCLLAATALALVLCLFAATALADDGQRDPHRTPRAGESYTTELLGREVHVPARDLRRVLAADFGVAATIPGTGGIRAVPFGGLFVFWRPDRERFVDAVVAGVFNDVFVGWSPDPTGGLELIATFNSSTIPAARSEIIDGEQRKPIQIEYGNVRAGLGIGYRKQVGLTVEDMMAISLIVEPGYAYFDRGADTATNFVVPPDTFEIQVRARMRFDRYERNLLSLIHSGFGFGAEALYGHRGRSSAWGLDGVQDGAEAADYGILRGYAQGAMGVPFVRSERHRLLGAAHLGFGFDVDRFSAPRIGGGPDADQFRAARKPVVPGAAIGEFYPDNYIVMQAEYRYEVFFFSYVGVRGSVSNLAANAETTASAPRGRRWLSSIGGRLTTGFFFRSRLRFDYSYNFNVIRDGSPGGSELLFDISREF